MNACTEELLSIGQFAKLAGVTVRTLRYYDEKELLKPRKYRESGYRLYSLSDLVTLEQIITLKFIGLSLEDIRNVLQHGELDIADVLRLQKQVIGDKIRRLVLVADAIQRTEESLQKNNNVDWNDFVHIIKVITMEQSQEWTKQFYTAEQLEKIKNRNFSQQDALDAQKRWNELIEEVRIHLEDDPASIEVQHLADRWLELIHEFTQGDEGIRSGLKNLYANMDSAPDEFKAYHARNKEVYAFMDKVLALRGQR